MEWTIRPERPADSPAIYELVRDAFAHAEHTDGDEQNLVERLRQDPAYLPTLALVAELEDGRIAGHIMFTEARVGAETVLVLAPLAVAREVQGAGIGGALIRAGHEKAKALGYRYAVLLGHAGYYPRFGYRRASEFGIRSPFEVPDDAFMAIPLQGDAPRLDGVVEYAKAFGL